MLLDQSIPEHPQQLFDSITSGLPIVIMRLHNESELWIDDFEEYCKDSHYRIASIWATSDCFGGARLQFYNWLVAYEPPSYGGANFNIAPPAKREYKQSVYDAIRELCGRPNDKWELRGDEDNTQEFDTWLADITADEMHVIELTANGWSTADTIKYSANPLPELERKFRRLSWQVCAQFNDDEIPIHPTENRPLTNGELSLLNYDTSTEWIEQQIELYYLDHWGMADWQSRYCSVRKQWLGGDMTGQFCKEFDLSEYAPLWCKPYDTAKLGNYIGWWGKYQTKPYKQNVILGE